MKAIILIFIVFVFSYGLGQWLGQTSGDALVTSSLHNSLCDPTTTECVVKSQAGGFRLSFEGEPSPLTPFNVKIKVDGVEPERIEIEFDMEEMDMGYNVYQLEKLQADWSGRVILPVCSLGRNVWNLRVKLINGSEQAVTVFQFSQKN